MAAEWIVSGGQPIDPRNLIADVEAAYKWVTHAKVSLNLVQDSEDGSGVVETDDEFNHVLESRSEKALSSVELNQLGFDPSGGTCFGYVTAYRTKLSVVLGILVAVCWHATAGGDLSGTGLGERRLSVDQSKKFLENLFRGATMQERVEWAAEKLGCGLFPYSYP